jgi:hypothetical protein
MIGAAMKSNRKTQLLSHLLRQGHVGYVSLVICRCGASTALVEPSQRVVVSLWGCCTYRQLSLPAGWLYRRVCPYQIQYTTERDQLLSKGRGKHLLKAAEDKSGKLQLKTIKESYAMAI